MKIISAKIARFSREVSSFINPLRCRYKLTLVFLFLSSNWKLLRYTLWDNFQKNIRALGAERKQGQRVRFNIGHYADRNHGDFWAEKPWMIFFVEWIFFVELIFLLNEYFCWMFLFCWTFFFLECEWIFLECEWFFLECEWIFLECECFFLECEWFCVCWILLHMSNHIRQVIAPQLLDKQ